ncbi:XdhC family protein [Amycolatopsis sp. RTGN1]|uniref:XdhC family protein n=1 Tax=Amycolatopsis ponsaeliensis TaxID=2992142 RepID=UPI00254E8382|nr:XdhC family protein [Amycolatopsis sp. RTGN1]
MHDWSMLDRARELSDRGETFAWATVVWRQGPSSGKEGCRAIVTADGVLDGWIGGACAEPAVVREAVRAIADGEPRLLLLGTSGRFGETVPAGMTVVPISCQSEGALEIYVEPVEPAPHLLVVGRSPMARTLVGLATALGWSAELIGRTEFDEIGPRSMVVVATQGHFDEDAIEGALRAGPAYVGLVGSRRRGEAVLGYLADRGVPRADLDRVRVPAGLDLGPVPHREIAVAILAELVAFRASRPAAGPSPVPEPVDPVCGMTVEPIGEAIEYEGQAYHFCCPGCRDAFRRDPGAYARKDVRC